MGWKYSRMAAEDLVNAARELGYLERARGAASPALRSLIDDSKSQPSWVEGVVVDELSTRVFETTSGKAVEAMFHRHVQNRIGRLLVPFVKVALALTGNDPRAFLSRMNSSLRPVSQNLGCEWLEESTTSGIIRVSHGGLAPSDASVPSWVGIMRYGFEMCGRGHSHTCTLKSRTERDGDYAVRWS